MSPKKPRQGARNFGAFPLDMEMSMPQRVAAFLDWWAEHQPYDFAGYHEITKAVNGYKHLPRLETQEVISMQSVVGRASKILHEKYRRALVRRRGLGARGTVDSADAIRHKAVDRARKVERDIVALATLDEIIDLKTVPDTPENRAMKDWYRRDVKGILKQVAAPEFTQRLLPPKQETDS